MREFIVGVSELHGLDVAEELLGDGGRQLGAEGRAELLKELVWVVYILIDILSRETAISLFLHLHVVVQILPEFTVVEALLAGKANEMSVKLYSRAFRKVLLNGEQQAPELPLCHLLDPKLILEEVVGELAEFQLPSGIQMLPYLLLVYLCDVPEHLLQRYELLGMLACADGRLLDRLEHVAREGGFKLPWWVSHAINASHDPSRGLLGLES